VFSLAKRELTYLPRYITVLSFVDKIFKLFISKSRDRGDQTEGNISL